MSLFNCIIIFINQVRDKVKHIDGKGTAAAVPGGVIYEMIVFSYIFDFGRGFRKRFTVELDERTLNLVRSERGLSPPWTELAFCQCPNCPLNAVDHPRCPVAVNVAEVVVFFRDAISYEEVDLTIETEARGYVRHTTLQQAISSLIGVYMVAGGCPVMEKLKPMVRFHLPFATAFETQYRMMSMYLLAQFFLVRRGREADWDLNGLSRIYDDVRLVNKSFAKRLSNVTNMDAALNAIVRLDMFAQKISMSIDRDVLDEMEGLFEAYF